MLSHSLSIVLYTCIYTSILYVMYWLLWAMPAAIKMKLNSSYWSGTQVGVDATFTQGPRPNCPESPWPTEYTLP